MTSSSSTTTEPTSGRRLRDAVPGVRMVEEQINALLIEVNEVTDRTENALQFIGDL